MILILIYLSIKSGNWCRSSQNAPGEGTVGVEKKLLLGLVRKLLPKLVGFLSAEAGPDSREKLRSNAEGEKRLCGIGESAAGTGDRIPGKAPCRPSAGPQSGSRSTSADARGEAFSKEAMRAAGERAPASAPAPAEDSAAEPGPVNLWTSVMNSPGWAWMIFGETE